MEKLPALVFIFIELFSKDIKIGLIIVLEKTLPDKTFELGISGTDKQYLKKTVKEKDLAS